MRDIIPEKNGFVFTTYNEHRKLIIRPDDVWLSIMTQFSFFVNGNSESLRKTFVVHKGKRELVVHSGGNRFTTDTPFMIKCMMRLMDSLREWIVPDFTMTKEVDRMTCAIVMMGMMKNCSTYGFCLMCGIPKVTLEGGKAGLGDPSHPTQKYSIQTTAWYRFISANDNPDNLEFWNKIAHRECGGSWITGFCVFNERGKWKGDPLNEEPVQVHDPKMLHLTPNTFAATYMKRRHSDGRLPIPEDRQRYHTVWVCARGCLVGQEVDTMLYAGSVGSQICSTEKSRPFRDTVRPVTGGNPR